MEGIENKHIEMVKSLSKPGEELNKTLETNPLLSQAVHMVLGICGEVEEVVSLLGEFKPDTNKLKLELGDLLFYCRGLEVYSASLNAACIAMETIKPLPEKSSPEKALTKAAGKLAELFKKHWAYNKPLDESAAFLQLVHIYASVKAVCSKTDISVEKVLQCNYDKLSVRYQGKYSDEAAIKRVDQKNE